MDRLKQTTLYTWKQEYYVSKYLLMLLNECYNTIAQGLTRANTDATHKSEQLK